MNLKNVISGRGGETNPFDFGETSVYDAVMSFLFFSAIASIFSNFDFSIPTGASSTVQLSDVAFTFMNVDWTWGVVLALGLFAVQVYQSAQAVGRSNEADVQEYIESLPTGTTILVGFTLVALVAFALQSQIGLASDIFGALTAEYWRQVGSVLLSTYGYLAITTEN
ncbi:hypothetical protein PNQ29_00630 [Halobacterium salinarum]|uniref:hypothetical protein n=1 Tax=Halobacterium salinarum TaxID=2242 RepID=UPI002552E22C|nr:hypothetical protein [Halobacterium salinarum]MDL0118265.1 hypothetical protein [Halobacterium salinarum]